MICNYLVRLSLVLAMAATPFLPVQAQEVPSAKDAKKMLFSSRKTAVTVRVLDPSLMGGVDVKQIEKNAPYYSSFAVTPTVGFAGTAASAALNFHSIAAANENAVTECNKKKNKTEADCVVVMEVVPAKYTDPRDFQLNREASKEFRSKYLRGKGPKAFAISQTTGAWGYHLKGASLDQSRAGAIAKCVSNSPSPDVLDCVVVTEN